LPFQQKAILKIAELYETKKRIAITCFEKDYKFCHRSKIGDVINREFGIGVNNL
jgi:uncharacterized protein (DUF488 family)